MSSAPKYFQTDLIPKIGYNGRLSSALERFDGHQLASPIRVADRRYIYFRLRNAEHDIYCTRESTTSVNLFFFLFFTTRTEFAWTFEDPISIIAYDAVCVALIEIQINIQFEYINVCAMILNTIGRRYPLDREGPDLEFVFSLFAYLSRTTSLLNWTFMSIFNRFVNIL